MTHSAGRSACNSVAVEKRQDLVGRGLAHLDARRRRQKGRVLPRIPPKPVGSGEGERNPKGSPYKHDRVGEIQLCIDRQIGIKRLERRMGAHEREAAFVYGLRQFDKFEMRCRSRGNSDANKRHRFCVAEENRDS